MATSSPMAPDTRINGVSGHFCLLIARADRPSKVGSLKSDRIRSGVNSVSAFKKAFRVETCWEEKFMFALRSSYSINSASAAISSRIKMRSF